MTVTHKKFWAYLLTLAILSGCAAPLAAPKPPLPTPSATPPTTTANGTTVVAVSPPPQNCCPHLTLPEFLGITGLIKGLAGLGARLRNRLGSIFPGLEATPELLAITDPKNLDSSNPAVKAAASVKGDEDASAQKIKALHYLATIGCGGCYPDVEAALLAALDDCSEPVRYEAVKALRELSGRPCSVCKTKSCCGPKVMAKLHKVATDMDSHGCYKESSARVRRLARVTSAGCGGSAPAATPTVPKEGPTEAPAEKTAAAEKSAPKTLVSQASQTTAPASADAHDDDDDDVGVEAKPASAETPVDDKAARDAAVRTLLNSSTSLDAASIPTVTPAPTATPVPTGKLATPKTATANKTAPASNTAANEKMATKAAAEPAKATTSQAVAEQPHETIHLETAEAAPAKTTPPAETQSTLHIGATSRATPITDRVLAQVNSEPIYESELAPAVERQLSKLELPSDPDRQLQVRQGLIERQLQQVINRKLLCQDARHVATTTNDVNRVSYDAALTLPGNAGKAPRSSADEETLAQDWLTSRVKIETIVSRDEIQQYYQTHQADMHRPEEVRVTRVIATFDRFASPEQARAVLKDLLDRHAAGAAVQVDGRLRIESLDWKARADFASEEFAQALFNMPTGVDSPILEDARGLQSVCVVNRHAPGVAPIELVADEIRDQLLRQRYLAAEQTYVKQLRERAKIWTIFDVQQH